MSLIFVFSCLLANVLCQTHVRLPAGQVIGHETKTYDGKAYLAFPAIPFAEPPTGKLRFEPPQAKKAWSGAITLPASNNICYQTDSNSNRENEDCLYITVYTPVLNAASNNTRLPVLFSIYGGGFRNGAVGINPNYWVQNDIVVVAASYRVGTFGFLSTGSSVLPGNAGLKDQQLALKWTHQNVHLFGGDNSAITIHGQSAGGASVGYHLLSPLSKGYFRAAIAESGSPLNTWTYLENPMEYVVELAEKINPSISKNLNAAQYVQYLQEVAAHNIDTAQAQTKLRPVVHVEPSASGAFITHPMYGLFANGEYNQVPLILGINSEERITIIDNMNYVVNAAKQRGTYPTGCLPDNYHLKSGINAATIGKYIHNVYTGSSGNFSNALGKYVKWESDNMFTRSVIKQGELMSKHSPVYFYQFSYKGPAGGYSKTIAGADTVGHGEENNYFSKDHRTLSAADALTQNRVLTMWISFIKHLNPTPQKLAVLENVIWPKVTPTNYEYLNINHTLAIEKQPKGQYFLGWQTIIDKYMQEPLVTY